MVGPACSSKEWYFLLRSQMETNSLTSRGRIIVLSALDNFSCSCLLLCRRQDVVNVHGRSRPCRAQTDTSTESSQYFSGTLGAPSCQNNSGNSSDDEACTSLDHHLFKALLNSVWDDLVGSRWCRRCCFGL